MAKSKTTKSTPKSTKTKLQTKVTNPKTSSKSATRKSKNETKDQSSPLIADNTTLQLTLPWTTIETAYQQVLKTAAQKLKIKGFRQGKVPIKVAEEKIGRENLIQDVLDKVVPSAYQQLIAQEKKQPLTMPAISPISLKWNQDWQLKVEIAEKPVLKLDKYQTAIKKGLTQAKKELAKLKKTDQSKTGPNSTKDETDHHHSAHDHAHHHHHQTDPYQIKLQHIFRELVGQFKPQIPELLLKEETKREIQRLVDELKKVGLTLDDYLARKKQKFEDMSSEIAIHVLGQLQLEFILEALEKKLGVKVEPTELKSEIDKIKDDNLKQQVERNPSYQDYLKRQLARNKLLHQLTTSDKKSKSN